MVFAISHGATTPYSISKSINLIVAGSNPGKSKVSKATELNTKVITVEEFFELINS